MTYRVKFFIRAVGLAGLIVGLTGCSRCVSEFKSTIEDPLENLLWGNGQVETKSGSAHSENEPNDSVKSANEIILSEATQVTGHLKGAGDVDWFRLSFEENDWNGTIEFKPQELSSQIRPCRLLDKSVRRKELTDLSNHPLSLSDGICLRVSAKVDELDYRLKFESGKQIDGSEPNDWMTHARPLPAKNKGKGKISSSSDRDVWRLDTEDAGAPVTVRLQSEGSVPISFLYHLSDQPFVVPLNAEFPVSTSSFSTKIGFQKRDEIEFSYLGTTMKTGETGISWIIVSAPEEVSYQIEFKEVEGENTENEPNNSPEKRHLIERSGRFKGKLSRPDDVDYFGFGKKRHSIRKRLKKIESRTQESPTYWRLSAEPESQQVRLAMRLSSLTDGETNPRKRTHRAERTGEVVSTCVSERKAISTAVKLYPVNFKNIDANDWPLEYELVADKKMPDSIDGPLTVPFETSIRVDGKAQKELEFSIEGPGMKSLLFDIQSDAFDVAFKLTDQNGGLIAEVDDAGLKEAEVMTVDLPKGKYRLEVMANKRDKSACPLVQLKAHFKGDSQ